MQGWGQSNQHQGQGWGQHNHQQGQGWGQPHSQPQHHTGGGLFNQIQEHTLTTALNGDLVLDISGDPKNKNYLIIWKKHGEQNQRFKFKFVNGKYMIVSGDGYCLEVADHSNGTQVHAGLPNNTPNQLWDLYPAKGQKNSFYIRSFCGKALDVCGQKGSKGTKVIQWDYNGQNNQIWHIRSI